MKSLALACSLPSAPSSLPPLIVGMIWFYSRLGVDLPTALVTS